MKPGKALHQTIPLFNLMLLMLLWPADVRSQDHRADSLYSASAPEEQPAYIHLEYGMNLGFYLAHSATANYYNGSGEYSLEKALNNSYTYNAIWQDIGYDFSLNSLPHNMSYSPAIMLGFFGTLNLNASWGILAEFNYVRLKAEDQIGLLIQRASYVTGDNIELYRIWGTEERIDLRLGVQHTFLSATSSIHPFVETGISMTDTKVIENRARIQSQTISLKNPRSNYLYLQDYGIGMGGFAAAGLKIAVTDFFSLKIGYSANALRINLGNNERFLWQHTAFVRLNLNQLL